MTIDHASDRWYTDDLFWYTCSIKVPAPLYPVVGINVRELLEKDFVLSEYSEYGD